MDFSNPLTYGVDGLREALTGMGHFSIWLDLLVVFLVTILVGLVGTYLFSKIEV